VGLNSNSGLSFGMLLQGNARARVRSEFAERAQAPPTGQEGNCPRTFVSLADVHVAWHSHHVEDIARQVERRAGTYRLRDRLFYKVFLPLGVLANLGLGVLILSGLHPEGWTGKLEVATGAFCCVVAGWLAAAAWSKSYWNNAMARQVFVWRRIADAFFAWLEEAPLPADALNRLKTSLDEAVPNNDPR
jgi:hypothetical protein